MIVFIELLIRDGLITRPELEQAKDRQRRHHGPIVIEERSLLQILVDLGNGRIR